MEESVTDKGRRVRGTIASAIAALALAVPAASADGGAKTRITMQKLSSTGAGGTVSSGKARCEPRRKVSLFMLESFITDKVAITYTDSKGQWRFDRRLKEGVYFAKVDSAKGCRYDNSRRKRLTIG
jgi:hypothetical protein